MGRVIFFAAALGILGGLHYYLWRRLVRGPRLSRVASRLVAAFLIAAGLAIPAVLLLRRSAPGRVLLWPAFLWLGLMFLLTVALIAADAIRLCLWLIRRFSGRPAIDEDRRRFLARWLAGGALAAAGGAAATATAAALGPVEVKRVELPMVRLSKRQDGFKLVQLTDLHIGLTIGPGALQDIVARTNSLSPDAVAITGDLVDGSVAELRQSVASLAELKTRHGVFFVTGNHEYFSGARAWVDELSRLGVRVLRNERITIGDQGASFELAGVDDRSAARYPDEGHGEDLAHALSGWDRKRPLILLAHQPRTVLDSSAFEIDLQLSGHTHGGQIWPFGALVRLQQRFLAGLGRHRQTMIYVSRGTGYWGPPMRLHAPAEITEIVLRAVA